MIFRKALVFVACLIAIVPVSSSLALLASKGPLWLHISSKAGFAPLKVLVDIHVTPLETDRTIWLSVYESGVEATTSEIPLTDGTESRRTHHWVWEAKWPGEYTIVAQVGHGNSIRASASERLNVP